MEHTWILFSIRLKNDSDLDIVFAISGDPDKEEIYPDLSEKLEKVMKVQAEIGENGKCRFKKLLRKFLQLKLLY